MCRGWDLISTPAPGWCLRRRLSNHGPAAPVRGSCEGPEAVGGRTAADRNGPQQIGSVRSEVHGLGSHLALARPRVRVRSDPSTFKPYTPMAAVLRSATGIAPDVQGLRLVLASTVGLRLGTFLEPRAAVSEPALQPFGVRPASLWMDAVGEHGSTASYRASIRQAERTRWPRWAAWSSRAPCDDSRSRGRVRRRFASMADRQSPVVVGW